jgi:hypothetical protein
MYNCAWSAGLATAGRRIIGLATIAVAGLTMAMVAPGKDGSTTTPISDAPQQALAEKQPQADLAEMVNASMNLSSSEIITLEVDPTPDIPITLNLTLDGQLVTLRMTPHSARSESYRLQAQIADGSLVEIVPGPVRTLRGGIMEIPGAAAAGSLLEDGLHTVIVMPDGGRWWVEPIIDRVAGAAANQYVLYRDQDVIPSGKVCGVTDADEVGHPAVIPGEGDGGGIAGSTIFCADIACDADFEYYVDHGSNVATVEAQINLVINTVNLQYESQCDIRHVISDIIVRTAEPDPYTSTDAGTLLCQFRNHWNANHAGIVRDVAHLFTGKNLNAPTIGIAFLSTICNVPANGCSSFANLAYSLVESDCCCCPAMACTTDLTAHELGHNWSAVHCCAGTTMNPGLQCANNFATQSIDEIVAFRNTRTCLNACEDGTTTLPFSDLFPSTTIDPAKWTGIQGTTSDTVGIAEPSAPNSARLNGSTAGGDQLRSAIMNTNGLTNLTLTYYFERRGGGESPESGEDLVIEYVASDDQWTELHRQLGSGADMTTYQQVTSVFPANATHDAFRLRFRAISSNANTDDWFVDNVGIVGTIPPSNNNCSTSAIVAGGSIGFNTTGATTDGPNEPIDCNFNGFTQIDKDVWYLYPAPCTGTATISLCGADYDSKLAVYGGSCPGGTSGLSLACADGGCGDDATVSFPVTSGQIYRVRVGGANGASGTGTMVLTCTPPSTPCPGDTNGDEVVNVDDLLEVIGAWGPCPGCPTDVNDDGVVNVDDLLGVINGWGACP